MLMERCGEGFWTGDPDTFPTGEGQLGVFSTLGLEPAANLRRKPVCLGERVRLRSSDPLGSPSTHLQDGPLGSSQGPWQGQRKGNYVIWWFLKATAPHTPGWIWVHRGALTSMTHKV